MPRVIRAATRAAVSENGLLVSYAPTPSGNQGGIVADIDPLASASNIQLVAPCYSLLLQFDPQDFSKIIGDVATDWKIAPVRRHARRAVTATS